MSKMLTSFDNIKLSLCKPKEQPTKNLKRNQGSIRVVWFNFSWGVVGFKAYKIEVTSTMTETI